MTGDLLALDLERLRFTLGVQDSLLESRPASNLACLHMKPAEGTAEVERRLFDLERALNDLGHRLTR